jgi:EAL domain-containing protein (putative c-di-GMP-specific phosphodiesterase class I)
LIKTIISLGDTFKLSLIAEGVETKAQESELIKLGCIQAQGYLYSKPVDSIVFHEQFIASLT